MICERCQFYKKGKLCQHEGGLSSSMGAEKVRFCTLYDQKIGIEEEIKKKTSME